VGVEPKWAPLCPAAYPRPTMGRVRQVKPNAERVAIALNQNRAVVAGLVPATRIGKAQSDNDRGGRDKATG